MSLVGLAEIAELLGVSKQVVANWRGRRPNFPAPVANLKAGPVWTSDSIASWARIENIPLQQSPEQRPGQVVRTPATVVAMMNMKGGVGKSTLTANLGWYAAVYRDLRVLLVDLDPQFNLSQYVLGIDGYEVLVREGAPTVEAIFRQGSGDPPVPFRNLIRPVQEWGDGSVLHVLPAGLELAWSMRLALERSHVLRDGLSAVRDEYDIIIIDCAPTESILSTAAYHAADYIFVPVKTEFLSTIGLPLLLRSLEEFRRNHINEAVPEIGGIIFNDTIERVEDARSRAYVRQVADEHGLYVFSNEVSRSASYAAGARSGKPIFMTDNARDLKKREFSLVAREFLERIGR